MSAIPAPPPVPPLRKQKQDVHELFTIEENQESSRIRDVSEQCRQIVENAELHDVRWLMCNRRVRSQIQGNAPRCGLVALSMAAEMAGCQSADITSTITNSQNNESELSCLLALAKRRGYSKHGEMLSALNLAALAEEYYGLCTHVMPDSSSKRDAVLGHLLRGQPILVPYDSAPNHEPCLLNGRKAHWAVLTGFLCAFADEKYNWLDLESLSTQIENKPSLYSVNNPSINGTILMPRNIVEGHLYVLAKQPKSQHIAVWSLVSLEKSNNNLIEMQRDLEDFVCPEGGIKEGLCGQIILLSKVHVENKIQL